MKNSAAKWLVNVCLLACLSMATPYVATAQELSLGINNAITSIDPHFHNLASNIKVNLHVYDRLIEQDEKQRLYPGLATEWKAVDDLTWEFKLRRGVKFHDGSDFDAEDVAATIRRVPWVPRSPASFFTYTRAITKVDIVDPHTIRFSTATAYPLMPVDLSTISIVPRRHENSPTEAFNEGTATAGTGPFKFIRYVPGERVELERNEGYWGEKPHWRKVTLRVITSDAPRVAALLAGDVQAIDSVPPNLISRLSSDPQVRISRTLANTVMFLHMDQFRDQTPFVTDKAGRPLASNPFKDVRVRQAFSKAMNRSGLVSRVMEGAAVPAGGLLAPGFFGVSPKLTPDKFDPDEARRLLAAAGYPNGFSLTIHGPIDRYVNDDELLQAIGPMLDRIGISVKLVTLPWANFISQAGPPTYAFSVFLIGNGATTGEMSFPIRAQFATVDPAKGMGASNRARYSNAQVDALLERAMLTVDDAKREFLLQQAAEVAMADQAVIPLVHEENVYATRSGLKFVARTDTFMPAQLIKPE